MDRAAYLIQSIFSGRAIRFNTGRDIGELRAEIVRKTIHFLIALTPTLASINKMATAALLIIGTLGYTLMEWLRLSGVKIPIISSIVSMASRQRDIGNFVMGPVTLGLGALAALLLYPSNAATIAIYALAFGDGIASLVGKFFGKWRPAFLSGKSVEGSMACFAAVLISAYAVCGNIHIACVAAFTATVVEALPMEDYDNIAIPVTVGLAVQFASIAL